MKKALIGVGILGAALLAWAAIGLFPLFTAIASTHPIKTGRINQNVFAIKTLASNLYIVYLGEDTICIDAGANIHQVRKAFEKLHIKPASVKLVFLTHCDTDHTAALPLFKNAQVYLSINEEPFITGEKHRKFIKKLPVDTYYTTNDGSITHLGNIQVKAIGTPGHTPGSVSYLVNETYLFTGDTLGLKNGKATTFSDYFNMDTAEQKSSICKLANLSNIALLCTGHHGVTDDFDQAMADWRK